MEGMEYLRIVTPSENTNGIYFQILQKKEIFISAVIGSTRNVILFLNNRFHHESKNRVEFHSNSIRSLRRLQKIEAIKREFSAAREVSR